MFMTKLLALDIDGTLINRQHELTDGVRETLLRAQREFGVRIILASGRPTPALRQLYEPLQLAQYGGYLLPFNGGKIYELPSGKLLSSALLSLDLIPQIYALTVKYGVKILTYTDTHIVVEKESDKYADKEIELTGMPLAVVPNFLEAITEPLAKCLAVGPTERIEELRAEILATLGDQVDAFRSSDVFLEIVPRGVDKGSSLERLLSVLSLTPADLMAIGDNYNDVGMLRMAGTPVAMGNAPADIQQLASFVTRTNEEDGVAYAVKRLIFNEEA